MESIKGISPGLHNWWWWSSQGTAIFLMQQQRETGTTPTLGNFGGLGSILALDTIVDSGAKSTTDSAQIDIMAVTILRKTLTVPSFSKPTSPTLGAYMPSGCGAGGAGPTPIPPITLHFSGTHK